MKLKLRRPRTSFWQYWMERHKRDYHKDMSYLYAIGAVVIQHEKIPERKRFAIAKLIESKIDKRQTDYHRMIKQDSGQWKHCPKDWDQRNWRWYFKLKKELRLKWKLNFK